MMRPTIQRLRIQVRCAHTRAKRVSVQLLKEPLGRRIKGEVFPVAEGHMRLKLHPQGIAAYVLPDQPTPIPMVLASTAQAIRRERQLASQEAALEAAKAAEKETATKTIAESVFQENSQQSLRAKNEDKINSFLDSLEFPGETETARPTSEAAATQREDTPVPPENQKQFDWQSDMVVKITNKE